MTFLKKSVGFTLIKMKELNLKLGGYGSTESKRRHRKITKRTGGSTNEAGMGNDLIYRKSYLDILHQGAGHNVGVS